MLVIESHCARLRAGRAKISLQFVAEKIMRVYVNVLTCYLDIKHIMLPIDLPPFDSECLYKFVSYEDRVNWWSEGHEHSFLSDQVRIKNNDMLE